MNKKIIIGIIIILGVVAVSGCIGNDELTINNVAGVDNVKLNNSLFSSPSSFEKGSDEYHGINGDVGVKYNPTGDTISFAVYSNSTDIEGWLEDDGYSNIEEMTINGIKGYYISDSDKAKQENVELGDNFIFVMNGKIYGFSVVSNNGENIGSVMDNKIGIELFLSAWLNASGYHQTWDYPETITQKAENSNNKSDWDPSTGKGTPTYEEMKGAANAKGDYDFSYDDYKENMKNWDPTEEHIG